MKPSFIAQSDITKDNNNDNPPNRTTTLQTWRKSGNCPKGTIPIRRVVKEDLIRADNLQIFGRKKPQYSNGSNNRTAILNNQVVSLGAQGNRSIAILFAAVTHFIGSKASLSVWNPRVASQDDYTTGQLWLQGGGPDDFESIEVGWMVNPKFYGDTQSRLFTYWTTDGSATTGCFDLVCTGFVQTSTEVALGAALNPVSSMGGQQYEIRVEIYLDNKTNNWWLRFNDNIDMGYWPMSLFGSYLRSGATLAQWGGEVHSPKVKTSPHTTTAMGSGDYAQSLFRYASYAAHIRTMDFSNTWVYPRYVATYADEVNCYTSYHYVPGFMTEPTLFFGGPGQNPRCH